MNPTDKVIVTPKPVVAGTDRNRLSKRPASSHELAFPAIKSETPSDEKGIAILPITRLKKRANHS
jgi:hypothetical protein